MRQNLLGRMKPTEDVLAIEHLVKFCLQPPPIRATLEELRPMVEILRPLHTDVRLEPDTDRRFLGWIALATAMFDLRDERYERARASVDDGLALTATPSCRSCLKVVLAMAAQRQGDNDVARRELAEADSMIQLAAPQVIVAKHEDYDATNGSWYAWACARILHREAAALIER